MSEKVIVPIPFAPEALAYCKETAEMQGITMPELIERFIDEGMRKLALESDFDEVIGDALCQIDQANERAERELDIPSAVRRSRRRKIKVEK